MSDFNRQLLASYTKTEFVSNASYTALAWVSLFSINDYFSELVALNDYVSWVFLPAAVRVLSVLMAGSAGVAGLFVGAMLTNHPVIGVNLIDAVALSLLSALGPAFAVWLVLRSFRIQSDLIGLRWQHLFCFAVVGALCNVIPTLFYLSIFGKVESIADSWWPMLVGDLVGTAIFLYIASLLAKIVRKLYERK